MEHVASIMGRIATQAPTTKEKATYMPRQRNGDSFSFHTFGDPQLERMLSEAELFLGDMHIGSSPRWLSFVGTSGTGKTFLGEQIFYRARGIPSLEYHYTLIRPILRVFWPELLCNLRDGEYWKLRDLSDANFVFIDEISVEHDPSGFARDKLCELLGRRVGKWTVLTSNLKLERLHAIDGRIASRLVRGGSVVVEVETIDYALRQTNTP